MEIAKKDRNIVSIRSFGEGVKNVPFAVLQAVVTTNVVTDGSGGNGSDFDPNQLKSKVETADFNVSAIKVEAKKISETVFSSSVDYYKILKSIKTLEVLDTSDLVITGKLKQLQAFYEEKKRIENLLTKAPEGMRDQFAVDLLQIMINETDPRTDAQVLYFMNLIKSGGAILKGNDFLKIGQRGREPNTDEIGEFKKSGWPKEAIFFYDDSGKKHDLLHIPSQLPGREGKISGADKKLFAAIRGLIKRYLAYCEEQAQKLIELDIIKVQEIKANVSDNYFHARNIAKVIPDIGTYYLFLPGKTEGEKKLGNDGACIVEVFNLNSGKTDQKLGGAMKPFYAIKIIDGAGSMRVFAENADNYFSHWWFLYYRENKRLPKNVPDKIHDVVLVICRKLDAAIACVNVQDRQDRQ